MSIFPQLFIGLITALQTDTLTKWAACEPATALASAATTNANFPINAADFATVCGVPAMTPTYIFACQETSGPLICSVTGELLVPYPFFATSPEMGVSVSGLEGGTRTAIRLDDNTAQAFQAVSSDFMDFVGGSWAAFAVFNGADDLRTVTLMGKGKGTTSATPTVDGGTTFKLDTSGRIGSSNSDGTTSASSGLLATDLCTGLWTGAAGVYNETAATIGTFHRTSSHTVSTSGLTYVALDNYFAFGQGIDGGRYVSGPLDLTYLVFFEGAAAEAVTSAGINTFLNQAIT